VMWKLAVFNDDFTVTLYTIISHGCEHALPLRNSHNSPIH
jgi:hypothetical protein